jgi:hypothetical protein
MLKTIKFWLDLVNYWYYRWARREILYTHSDGKKVAEILRKISEFETKYGEWGFKL